MGYGWEIRRQFAKAYARNGNATHALKMVLGEERAEKCNRTHYAQKLASY